MAGKSYASMSVGQLTKMNQKLGRDHDALRKERQAINKAIVAKLPVVPASPDGKLAFVTQDAPAK